jgi:hypothetical protein
MTLYKVPELTDFNWQTSVTNQTTNTPPSVVKGARYIVGSSPTDVWVGYSKYIATYNGSSWDFTTPIVGMICYITAESLLYIYSGSTWGVFSASQVGLGNVTNNAQVIADGTVNPTNLLLNGSFENWSKSYPPDEWTLTGNSAPLKETTIVKLGTISVNLPALISQTELIYQDIHILEGISYWKGRIITFGCWVYAANASRAYIYVDDGVSSISYSSPHPGDSTWHFLTITATVGATATRVRCACFINGATAINAYFDGAIAVEGTSIFSFANAPQDYGFIDRGDPSTYDKTLVDLTTDGVYHDLDLSAIVPIGAKLILLRIFILDDAVASQLRFRKNGNSNGYNASYIKTQVANVELDADMLVSCDSSRIIEYITTNTTFTGIGITVAGWWF